MKSLTSTKPLNDHLSRVFNHAVLVGVGLKTEDAFNISFNSPLSLCCAMPLYREGSYEFCSYCQEFHNSEL
jgi:hypothetical protein